MTGLHDRSISCLMSTSADVELDQISCGGIVGQIGQVTLRKVAINDYNAVVVMDVQFHGRAGVELSKVTALGWLAPVKKLAARMSAERVNNRSA